MRNNVSVIIPGQERLQIFPRCLVNGHNKLSWAGHDGQASETQSKTTHEATKKNKSVLLGRHEDLHDPLRVDVGGNSKNV